MKERKYDYIVVGSGAGGATVARELAKRKKSVLVIEKGKDIKTLGTFRASLGFYDKNRSGLSLRTSKEGTGIIRTLMGGGSTIVSCGNAVRCLERELAQLGVDLSDEFAQTEQELHVAPIAERLLSNGSRALMQSGKELGYSLELMPKFIDPEKCRKCGACIFGCPNGAKWTSLGYLAEAVRDSADVVYETTVESVISENGKAKGVRTKGRQGSKNIYSDAVVLAAGGIGTPVILLNSGIEDAGTGLYIDLLINTFGVTDDAKLSEIHEPSMTFVDLEFHKSKGFILSTAEHHGGLVRVLTYGAKSLLTPEGKTLTMMTKITDEPAGRVFADGSISKPITTQDRARLKEGSRTCREILSKAGAKRFGVSSVTGAHTGGTAALGKIVDKDLQTKIDGLFVSDCSVLPEAPGLPPILTIVALSKHLAKRLTP